MARIQKNTEALELKTSTTNPDANISPDLTNTPRRRQSKAAKEAAKQVKVEKHALRDLIAQKKKLISGRLKDPAIGTYKKISGKHYLYCYGFYSFYPAEDFNHSAKYSDEFLIFKKAHGVDGKLITSQTTT